MKNVHNFRSKEAGENYRIQTKTMSII